MELQKPELRRNSKVKILERVGISIVISCIVYLTIAFILIYTDKPQKNVSSNDGAISFDAAVNADYSTLPHLENYTSRDGSQLGYRNYDGNSETLLILVHGSGWHGMQFHPMASSVSSGGVADVVVPDLRGHGPSPLRRGDVDYIGQMEDDISDLIKFVSSKKDYDSIILGGHSSGGGLVIRYAGNKSVEKVDNYILMAPYLKYNAPTTKENSGGWANPSTRRITGLSMLNNVGIKVLNHLPVISFAMSQEVLDGPLGNTATTEYTYRLNTGFAPRMNYTKDIASLDKPFLLVAGDEDEAFNVNEYEPLMNKHSKFGEYVIIEGLDHIEITTDDQATGLVKSWISNNEN